VEGKGPHKTIRLTQDPPENFCRPAVDPLFRSLARQYGSKLLGVVLTGMGHDGRNGAEAIVTAGGTVLAQDEATSVVWGMPAAIAQAGLASAILPLNDLPRKVTTLIKDGRS
ncbi:MAG: CheB methylesterase domain-containing protein, partial [Pseudomonadota bacterium]